MKRILVLVLAAAALDAFGATTNATKVATQAWVEKAIRKMADSLAAQKDSEIGTADETITPVSTNPAVWAVSVAYVNEAGGVGVTQRLCSVTSSIVYEPGQYPGGVVKSSSIPAFPKGMKFAATSELEFRCAATNLPGSALWATNVPTAWTIQTNAVAGTTNWEWKIAPAEAAGGGVLWTWEDLGVDVRAIAYTNASACTTNVIGGVTNVVNGEKRVLGSFTLTPLRLTAEQQTAATGEAACEISPEPAWCARFPRKATSFSITTAPSAAGSAAGGSSGSGGATTTITIPDLPIVPMDWHGEIGDDHYWIPPDWWTEGTWNAEASWISLPVTLIMYVGDDENGNPVYNNRKFRSLGQLRLLGVAVPPIPPSPWVAPRKVSTPKCAKIGHEWENCECKRCGAKRAHRFEPADQNGMQCAKCKNMDTAWEKNDDGEYAIKDTAECGNGEAKNLPADPAYHAGWHNQGGDQESDYNCACACGKYDVAALALMHDLEDTGGYEEIPGEGGAGQHYALRECRRCGATRKKRQDHDIDTSAEANGSYTGYDDPVYHHASGPCRKCPKPNCEFTQRHFFDDAGSCECSGCGETHHTDDTGDAGVETDCGNLECGRCGVSLSGEERHLFNGGPSQTGFLGSAWQIDPIEGPLTINLTLGGQSTLVESGKTWRGHKCNCCKGGNDAVYDGEGWLDSVEECTSMAMQNRAGAWGYFCFHCGRNMDPSGQGRTWEENPDEEDPDCPYHNSIGKHTWPSGSSRGKRPGVGMDRKCPGCNSDKPIPTDHGFGTFSLSYPVTWGWEIESDDLEQNEDGTYKRTLKYVCKTRFKCGYYTDADLHYVLVVDETIIVHCTETYDFSM